MPTVYFRSLAHAVFGGICPKSSESHQWIPTSNPDANTLGAWLKPQFGRAAPRARLRARLRITLLGAAALRARRAPPCRSKLPPLRPAAAEGTTPGYVSSTYGTFHFFESACHLLALRSRRVNTRSKQFQAKQLQETSKNMVSSHALSRHPPRPKPQGRIYKIPWFPIRFACELHTRPLFL